MYGGKELLYQSLSISIFKVIILHYLYFKHIEVNVTFYFFIDYLLNNK